jgi:serine/threonine-protein kinase
MNHVVERFLSEIKTTARLSHPHILPLLDSGAADGFCST